MTMRYVLSDCGAAADTFTYKEVFIRDDDMSKVINLNIVISEVTLKVFAILLLIFLRNIL